MKFELGSRVRSTRFIRFFTLDALQVKVKSQGSVRNKAVYLAFGVGMSGLKEVLGIWSADTEGSRVLDAGHYAIEDARSSRHLHRLR